MSQEPLDLLSKGGRRYLIDTSAFIEFEEFYPPKDLELFWSFLDSKIKERKIFTVEEVFAELDRKFYDREVTKWVNNRKKELRFVYRPEHFEYLKNVVLKDCGEIIDLDMSNPEYADPMLLMVAGYEGFTIVTAEVRKDGLRPNTRPDKIKIPNYCDRLGINHFSGKYAWRDFFKEEGLRIPKP
jgi:hypothetical protein